MYSVMWSEHCSYKSSKIYLRKFGEKVSDQMKERLMVGMGQNAGVVDIGEGWAVTFKVESHNHPSYIEPFQGAATGVGGIVRDIISMGARPVAVMDQLRFGAIDDPDTARVVHGVVSGISFYGNCLGLPNIGGETVFDAVYQGNPLVNALAVGVLRHEDLKLANATGAGNKVVLFGARTGGDGIGGASILASDTFSEGGPTKRPAVQVGDPFAEKVLIECCLELYRDELVEAIQDLGAAGISCATSELAANGGSGMRVDLENVLLRDPTLTPEEILMSESQERMMAIVAPEKLDAFLAVVGKWDVETSVLGEVTGDGRLQIFWHGEEIVNVDPSTVAVDGPVYERPVAYPTWLDAVQADSAAHLPRATGAELRDQVLRGDADLQPPPPAAHPDGVERLHELVDEGRQRAALAERADPAGDVARHLLRPVGRGERDALAERARVELGARRDEAGGQRPVAVDDERLEHRVRIEAERLGGLERVGARAGVVLVLAQLERDARLAQRARRGCLASGHLRGAAAPRTRRPAPARRRGRAAGRSGSPGRSSRGSAAPRRRRGRRDGRRRPRWCRSSRTSARPR
jgi:hydrogenase maturation factor